MHSLVAAAVRSMELVEHLKNFSVIELRRYTVRPGERQNFARYFESFFPEVFEQLGAIIFGSFFERNGESAFTWLRGFHTLADRAIVSSTFYYGPVWKEHKATVNDMLLDSDNVLLLQPLNTEREVTVLPAVDPIREPDGGRGVVLLQIFPVQANSVSVFAEKAETFFERYRSAGAREAGVLITLDASNNFPQLPIRTDGPYLVWVGILEDERTLKHQLMPLAQQSLPSLMASGLLRGEPELVVLDPTHRSRLRWLP